MSASPRPAAVRLAESSGIALIEQDGRLLVADQGIAWTWTASFVLGLVGFIFGLNGLAQLLLWLLSGEGILLVGLIFLPLGLLGLGGVAALWQRRRRRRALPPDALRLIASFDLRAGVLRDGRGEERCRLGDVRLVRRFQFTASAPCLAAVWPGGSLVLVRGNVFAGGIGAVEGALRERLPAA